MLQLIELSKTRLLGWTELKIFLSFIGANLLYLNGQRPAAMENMKLLEFEQRQETGDGRYYIKVAEHKTAGTYGPAVLLISPKVSYLMECYYTYTRKLTIPQPACHEYFFLKDDGGKLNTISEIMKSVGKMYNCNLPNPTLHKKVITFKGANSDNLQLMRRHMTHSALTLPLH